MAKQDARAEKTIQKLRAMGLETVREVGAGKNPSIEIPLRALSNVNFNERKQIIELGTAKQERFLFKVGMARKFMQTFLVASACKDLLEAGKTTSIRDLYYITKHTLGSSRANTFEEQDESDPIIEDLEVTIDSLREELNLHASNKGAAVGDITVVDSGDTIDLRHMGSGGWSVPSICEPNVIQFKNNKAKYVLLVEKDAVWRRLNEDKFWLKHHCILVHGGGMVARGLRRFLYRLHNELELPVYVVVDNDPWGLYIYSVVKQGSINLAYESVRMAIPKARFLGLSSFDREQFELPPNVTIKLNDQDKRRAEQMLKYPWFEKKQWQKEIQHLLKSGVKLELEALSAKGISFISDRYLSQKIEAKQFLV
ncbi:MAG TPA: DNA topoisomerase IV subunit A [Myxococcota bacterium]|jgi:DNA topoisomerase-6 subunit A|nr:DNA topoisomerase IV subunit A [Myxococcota bacterium]